MRDTTEDAEDEPEDDDFDDSLVSRRRKIHVTHEIGTRNAKVLLYARAFRGISQFVEPSVSS